VQDCKGVDGVKVGVGIVMIQGKRFLYLSTVVMLMIMIKFFLFIWLFTAIGLLPGGSGYFTCKQNMKLVTTRFKSGGLYEKHVVATWNVGNRLSICL